MKDLKDLSHNFPIGFKEFCEDEYVIYKHNHHPFINEFFEDFIHHCLEHGWAVGEAKEHY